MNRFLRYQHRGAPGPEWIRNPFWSICLWTLGISSTMEPPMQKQRHGTGVDSAGAPAPSVEVWGGVNLSEHKWVFFGEYCRGDP